MVAPWMVRVLIASGLIAMGSLLVERALQAVGGARRAAWVAGLFASVGLPVLVWLAPGFVAEATVVRLDFSALSAGEPSAVVRSMLSAERGPLSGDGLVIAAWLGAAVLVASLYGLGWWRLRTARRAWREDRLAGRVVLVSAGVGPAVVGFVKPAIVVPEWLFSEDETVQRLVVLHEAEHVEAGDHLLLALAPLALVLAPWNPAFWFMVWRLRIAVEVDCDRRVLARGVRAADYGSLLIDVAGRTPAFGYGTPFATRRTNLERRLLALTAVNPRLASLRALLYGSAALTLGFMACGAAAPTAGRSLVDVHRDMPVAFPGEDVSYRIDGEPADEVKVRSLPRSRIAHVEVARRQQIERRDGGDSVMATRLVQVFTKEYAGLHPRTDTGADPVAAVHRSIQEVRDRLRGERPDVFIDDKPSTFEAFDALAADRIASLIVKQPRRGEAAKPEIRVLTRPSGTRQIISELLPRDES